MDTGAFTPGDWIIAPDWSEIRVSEQTTMGFRDDLLEARSTFSAALDSVVDPFALRFDVILGISHAVLAKPSARGENCS